jgi:heme A synthase
MKNLSQVPHIVWAIIALALVLGAYIALVITHGTNPKLMDGALILIGAVAALARGDVPPGSSD